MRKKKEKLRARGCTDLIPIRYGRYLEGRVPKLRIARHLAIRLGVVVVDPLPLKAIITRLKQARGIESTHAPVGDMVRGIKGKQHDLIVSRIIYSLSLSMYSQARSIIPTTVLSIVMEG